ncbi:RNA-binding protein [Lentzea sp. NPDC004789]
MHVFKVTKYDPAHFGERGYFGPLESRSDRGPLEAAYLAAVEAFALDTGVTELTVREPEISKRHGLTELFPPDLSGYHDGARVPLATGVALVRAMLRDNGAWCRLEDGERFFVHVGFDQYMYIGSAEPCDDAVTRARAAGLFPVPIDGSPYDPYREELEEPRPADDAFWAEVTQLVLDRGTVILEERYVRNASRWHRLCASDVAAIRARLTPRAGLAVWPELNDDVVAELRTLDDHDVATLVFQDRDGRITDRRVHGDDRPAIAVELTKAVGAMVISGYADEENPLLTAVLPDEDGVVRVRWSA